jgi:alginate O-acetyltransferase complex protein AlgJ
VHVVAGPASSTPDQRARAKAAADADEPPLHPDPRPAVLALHRRCRPGDPPGAVPGAGQGAAAAGAAARPAATEVGRQPRLPALRARAARGRRAGLRSHAARRSPGEPPRFLVQDTHWTPAWMEEVAGQLARFVRANVRCRAVPRRAGRRAAADRAVGDIVDMLKLPEGRRLFAPQSGDRAPGAGRRRPLGAEPTADVLLLGDSFTNVFSLERMGWGEAAGLAAAPDSGAGAPEST